MGKSCVRFKKLDDVPLDVVGAAIARTSVDDFIAAIRAQPRLSAAAPSLRSGSVPAPAMLRIASGTGGGGAGRSPSGRGHTIGVHGTVDRRADGDAVAVDARCQESLRRVQPSAK